MGKDIILKFNEVTKEFTDSVGFRIRLFDKISFEVPADKVTAVIAPTGAGKTSLLKIAAGLQNPTSGKIEKGQSLNTVFIPSAASSYPWLNFKENLKLVDQKISEDRILSLSKTVGLEGYEEHFPDNKSLGFRFRISLGRALALNPKLIILDEPFSKMDSKTKGEIYSLIRTVCAEMKVSFLLGTTNISEGIFLADYIYLMRKDPGRIIDKMDNPLPEIRSLDLFENDDFLKLRNDVEIKFQTNSSNKMLNFSI